MPAIGAMAVVPTAVLDHWHEKPLVVDISGANIAARSPPAATVLAGNSQQLQKERSSPVFSPDRLDIAAAATSSCCHISTENRRFCVVSMTKIQVYIRRTVSELLIL